MPGQQNTGVHSPLKIPQSEGLPGGLLQLGPQASQEICSNADMGWPLSSRHSTLLCLQALPGNSGMSPSLLQPLAPSN